MRAYRPSLTVAILAALTCLLVLTWLLFSLLAFKTAENDLYAQKSEHARVLLTTFVNQLPEQLPHFPEGMLPLDAPAALYAAKLSEDTSFERLTLLDSNGKVIYSVGKEGRDIYQPLALPGKQPEEAAILANNAGLVRTALVLRNGIAVGRAGLLLSLEAEHRRILRTRQLLLTYFVLDFILLLGIGAYSLSRIVVLPVNRLLAATEKITDGDYGHQVVVGGTRELADLAGSFNDMSLTLLTKQQELVSHVARLEQMNRDLQMAREETVRSEKLASVGLLAAGTAHEIGTPLASVMGYTEILAQELAQNPAHADYLARIQDGCSRIDRIVKGLLEYARPKVAACERFDLVPLIQRTVELLQHQGVLKKVTVSLKADKSPPLLVLDPYQLQQVLINLLINAADAMPQGGTVEFAIKVVDDNRSVILTIRDNGTGIAPENLNKLFDPFFTTKEPGKGTGLGLAIVARIVDSWGGRITVQSKLGQGSCFAVQLPLVGKGCVA